MLIRSATRQEAADVNVGAAACEAVAKAQTTLTRPCSLNWSSRSIACASTPVHSPDQPTESPRMPEVAKPAQEESEGAREAMSGLWESA